MDKELSLLKEIIRKSRNTVFFGGAGVSTESGIPDFRSEAGLYAAESVYGYPPEELLSHHLFEQEPALFFRYYKENLVTPYAKPNAAHLALAELEARGLLKAVITQNIDGLHQEAGSQNVLELHGSNKRQYCMGCGARYEMEYILTPAHCRGDGVPVCEKCKGIVRPDVVLYEEGLCDKTTAAALRAISSAEVLLVCGTSLVVYPAAGMLRYFCGSHLVLINKSKTAYDASAQLVIHHAIGEVLGQVVHGL